MAQRGQLAPDFELTLFDGETMRLSDLRGKIVVLNFWASWCPPCRWEMPDFEEMWQEYGDRDVVFVGVAISDFEESAFAFAQETGVTYPVGLDYTGDIARAYRPTSMPTTFFIDREGIVSRKLVSVANKAVLRVFLDGQLREG
jgi:peroxiredoxin